MSIQLKKRGIFSIIALVLILLLMAGCGGGESTGEQPQETETSESKYQLTWGTAPAGGAWQVIGTAMLEDVTKANPNIVGTTAPIGGFGNVMGLAEGKVQIAFSLSATTGDAWKGEGVFEESGPLKDLRILAMLFPEPTHIVVNADSGIEALEDLKGKKITPGPRGSAVEQDTRRVLDAYGLTYDDFYVEMISFEEAAQHMLDGHIEAIVYGAMLMPAPNIMNVSSQKAIKLISLPDDKIKAIVDANLGVVPGQIPAGTYTGVDYPVNGIATVCQIVVTKDMPDEVAYNITKTIAENFERYPIVSNAMSLCSKEDMYMDSEIPFHPGALKYYQEQGWAK